MALPLLAALAASAPAHGSELGEIRALLVSGNLPAALERAQRAARADPRDGQARFLAGVALMGLHRDDEAMPVFVALSREFPELPEPYNNIAVLDARAGRLEQAQHALLTALRNDPAYRRARANLGQVHLMLAVQAWQAAAAEGPADPALQRKLEATRGLLAEPLLAAR
ncbi:MAG: tetratricopeptide repeat protein [Burkholderiales bacterium]|nr:tetratricopeptide repeat protein [Burkholderiales bacterium]